MFLATRVNCKHLVTFFGLHVVMAAAATLRKAEFRVCTSHGKWPAWGNPLLPWRSPTCPWRWGWGGIPASGSPETPRWSAALLRTQRRVFTKHLPSQWISALKVSSYRRLRLSHRGFGQTGALRGRSPALATPRSPWSSHSTCRSTHSKRMLSGRRLARFSSWRCFGERTLSGMKWLRPKP